MDDDLVTLASYRDVIEANVVRSRLESEGIPCFLADEHLVQMNWLYSDAIGGVKLQVVESDVEEAMRILRGNPELAGFGLGGSDGLKVEDCLACGSEDVVMDKMPRRLLFLSWLLLGVPILFLKRRWRCEACGHRWKGRL